MTRSLLAAPLVALALPSSVALFPRGASDARPVEGPSRLDDAADDAADDAGSAEASDGGPSASTVFDLALCFVDSANAPASFAILDLDAESDDAAWTIVRGTDAEVGLCPGETTDGSVVWRALDGVDHARDEPLRFVPDLDGWRLEPVEGLELDDVEWSESSTRGGPTRQSFQLRSGNVLHDAQRFEPEFGEPGLLTISANAAFVEIWREVDGAWTNETLWTDLVGERQQRLRRCAIGDVDGDGSEEVVVVTHDGGSVLVLDQTEDGFVGRRVYTSPLPYGQSCALGQVDADGALEIFVSFSATLHFDGRPTPGRVTRLDIGPDGAVEATSVVESDVTFATRVFAVDVDPTATGEGAGRDELVVAYQAPDMKPTFESDEPLELAVVRFDDDATATLEMERTIDAASVGELAAGDLDGDGRSEIVVSTMRDGIHLLRPPHGPDASWVRQKVVAGVRSGGYEHPIDVVDLDGDGRDEIVAVGDDQKALQVFAWDPGSERFRPSARFELPWELGITFALRAVPRRADRVASGEGDEPGGAAGDAVSGGAAGAEGQR